LGVREEGVEGEIIRKWGTIPRPPSQKRKGNGFVVLWVGTSKKKSAVRGGERRGGGRKRISGSKNGTKKKENKGA